MNRSVHTKEDCPECNRSPTVPNGVVMTEAQYQEALARLAECEGINDAQRAARLAHIQSIPREGEPT